MKLSNKLILWAGSEESFDMVIEAHSRLAALEARGPEAIKAKIMEMKMKGGSLDASPFSLPSLYTVTDGVAVLNISGPMVQGSAGFMRLFGVIGYDDIKEAAMDAVSQKSVKSLLLHINSGGGMVAGAEENSATLKRLGDIKPIHTYTDSIMGSAAYWAGSAGSHIAGSKTAQVGSVGVIVRHAEATEMFAKEGIKHTTIRAGEFKQLANPYEKLSAEAQKELQDQVEQVYDVFAGDVSKNLGVDRKKFDATMGRGREFMGMKAQEVGLLHATMTFDEAFQHAKSVDSSKLNNQNSRIRNKDTAMKATLASAYILQIAAGVAVSALDFTKAEANAEGVAADADGQTALKAQAITLKADLDAATAAAVSAATEPLSAELTALKATHAATSTELGAQRATNSALAEKVTRLETDMTASEAIMAGSLANMCTALQTAAPAADLKGPALLAEHARVEALFATKFPNARVSAVTTGVGDAKKPVKTEQLPAYAMVARNLRQAV